MLSESSSEITDDKGKYHINTSNPQELALSTAVVRYFANMATSGDPNYAGGAAWPEFGSKDAEQGGTSLLFGDGMAPSSAWGVRASKCISTWKQGTCDCLA